MIELLGRVPQRMVRRALFRDKHFDQNGNFVLKDVDELTQLEKETIIYDTGLPRRDLGADLKKYGKLQVIFLFI